MANRVRTVLEPIESDVTEIVLRFGRRTGKDPQGADVVIETIDMDIFADARSADGPVERIRSTLGDVDMTADDRKKARALLPVGLPGLKSENGF